MKPITITSQILKRMQKTTTDEKDHIILQILLNTHTKLKPSKVCKGVGVFALTDIDPGTVIFADVKPDTTYIEWEEIEPAPKEVKKYLRKMCNSDERGFYISRTPNNINISYYINHSKKPNVIHDLEKDVYLAIKKIKKGEELLCCYTPEEKDF